MQTKVADADLAFQLKTSKHNNINRRDSVLVGWVSFCLSINYIYSWHQLTDQDENVEGVINILLSKYDLNLRKSMLLQPSARLLNTIILSLSIFRLAPS